MSCVPCLRLHSCLLPLLQQYQLHSSSVFISTYSVGLPKGAEISFTCQNLFFTINVINTLAFARPGNISILGREKCLFSALLSWLRSMQILHFVDSFIKNTTLLVHTVFSLNCVMVHLSIRLLSFSFRRSIRATETQDFGLSLVGC